MESGRSLWWRTTGARHRKSDIRPSSQLTDAPAGLGYRGTPWRRVPPEARSRLISSTRQERAAALRWMSNAIPALLKPIGPQPQACPVRVLAARAFVTARPLLPAALAVPDSLHSASRCVRRESARCKRGTERQPPIQSLPSTKNSSSLRACVAFSSEFTS